MSKNISSYDRKKPEIKPDTPSRSSRLIKEAGWFVLIAITLYFLLIFLSYDKTDPGWSHASQITHISNLGGRIGAFIADILFFTFGLSAWWVVLWFLKASWTGYKRISRLLLLQEEPEPSWFRDRILKNIGFLILLFSSSGVEYLRMYNMRIQLPRIPGGVVGEIVGNTAQHYLGFMSGTLLLLLLCAVGFSLFLQMSWLQLVENIGAGLETVFGFFMKAKSGAGRPENRTGRFRQTRGNRQSGKSQSNRSTTDAHRTASCRRAEIRTCRERKTGRSLFRHARWRTATAFPA